MTPTALITGITGQDGFYLASQLLADGVRVVGTTRDPDKAQLDAALHGQVELVDWDLIRPDRFAAILREHTPAEIYNLAAFTSGEFMDRNPERVVDINGVAVLRMLEVIREVNPGIRFFQASSSEVFAAAGVSPQDERTARMPRSVYGAAKIYADNIVSLYRLKYDLFACSAFLFNHESPRRAEGFVTQKIVQAAVRIKRGEQDRLFLGNLSAARDWSFAGDFTRAMRLMLAADTPRDYVIASGQARTVAEFCDCAFTALGLDYREFVAIDPRHYRSDEPAPIVGNISRAQAELGWTPSTSFQDMIAQMIDSAMRQRATVT